LNYLSPTKQSERYHVVFAMAGKWGDGRQVLLYKKGRKTSTSDVNPTKKYSST